jgi:hypothetical protein
VIVSDDEDDDEVQVVEVRPHRNNNTRNTRRNGGAGGGGGGRRAAGTSNAHGDLDGFIVSDSEEQSSSEEEEEILSLEERSRRLQSGGGGGGAGTRRGARGDRHLSRQQAQRQRHARAVQEALHSDFEEEIDWNAVSGSEEEEEEEELDLESPAVTGGGWRRVRRENNNTANTTTRNNSGRRAPTTTRQPRQERKKRRHQEVQSEEEKEELQQGFSARHAVEVLTENWDSIRRGTTSFNQVLAGSGNNRRSRQGREAHRAKMKEDVIDLSKSPAGTAAAATAAVGGGTAGNAQRSIRQGGLSPPLGISSLSSKLRAELNACREKGARLPPRKMSTGGGGSGGGAGGGGVASTSGAAAAAANNRKLNDSTPDDYFAAADIAARLGPNNSIKKSKNRAPAAAPQPPQHPPSTTPRSSGSALWRRTNTMGSSPGSGGPHRMRTVRDVNRGAEVARRTPGSVGNGGSARPNPSSLLNFKKQADPLNQSPAPLQQRLAARRAAEWGNDGGTVGASGSGGGGGGGGLPAWRQAKRPGVSQQQNSQFRPRLIANPNPRLYPLPSSSPTPLPKQRQPPPQPEVLENRNIPMFLRNQRTINNANQMQQQHHVQSPSYSPPPSVPPKRNIAAVNNNNNVTATTENFKNPKQQAYDAVRSHVRLYFDEGAINREQYKKIARAATRHLYQRHGGAPPNDVLNSQEVALVVDEALVAVIRGEV